MRINRSGIVGFWFGGGLGYGSLGCKDCDERTGSGTGYINLGGTLSKKVLLGFESNGWVKTENSATVSMVNGSAAIYFYPSATGGFFLKAGLGVSSFKASVDLGGGTNVSNTQTGAGGMFGLGYDVRIGRKVSLVPFGTFVGGTFDGDDANFFQIGLGITAH